jgi:hypothetical protein
VGFLAGFGILVMFEETKFGAGLVLVGLLRKTLENSDGAVGGLISGFDNLQRVVGARLHYNFRIAVLNNRFWSKLSIKFISEGKEGL